MNLKACYQNAFFGIKASEVDHIGRSLGKVKNHIAGGALLGVRSRGEDEEVVIGPTAQEILAGATINAVLTVRPLDDVAPRAAPEVVMAVFAEQDIVSGVAEDEIIERSGMDRVVAETSRDAILGAVSDDDVVALLTERIKTGVDINRVGALAAENRPAVNSRVAIIVAIQRYGGPAGLAPNRLYSPV